MTNATASDRKVSFWTSNFMPRWPGRVPMANNLETRRHAGRAVPHSRHRRRPRDGRARNAAVGKMSRKASNRNRDGTHRRTGGNTASDACLALWSESIRCGLVGGLCFNDRQRKAARISQQVIEAHGWLVDKTLTNGITRSSVMVHCSAKQRPQHAVTTTERSGQCGSSHPID
jgi:hypothetical protein